MSKEGPAWKAELRSGLRQVIRGEINLHEFVDLAASHIKAAEQRGRGAADARLEAVKALHENDRWHCGTCADEFGGAARWPCPTAQAVEDSL